MKKQNDLTAETLTQSLREQVLSTVSVLGDKGVTLGFAESCTGGLLSSFMTELSGVSKVFMGSVVSYDNQVKQNILKVSAETLKSSGAVSAECAKQMAEGAVQVLGVSVAVSVTGIAGPTGGTPTKPVGTVFIAVAGLNRETKAFQQNFSGDRKLIQLQSCSEALKKLEEFLN